MKNKEKAASPVGVSFSDFRGILSWIFVAVFGPIFIVATLCFALNFACDFAGVDFDAFVWVQDFLAQLPLLLQQLIDLAKTLIDTVLGFLE